MLGPRTPLSTAKFYSEEYKRQNETITNHSKRLNTLENEIKAVKKTSKGNKDNIYDNRKRSMRETLVFFGNEEEEPDNTS